MSIFEPIRRPFKILDEDQSIKKGVTAHSLADLIERGAEKLGLPSGHKVKLALEDGTEIDDEDYFLTVPENSTLIFKSSIVDSHAKQAPADPIKQKKQERSNLRSTTSRYKETEKQPPAQSPNNSRQPLQQPFFKPAPSPLMSAPVYPRQDQHDFNIKPVKGVYTLTFTTENLIDLRVIEAEFRCFGPVEAESDYNRMNGRARVFVNFSEAQHAMDALYQFKNCFYDLQISKHCIGKPKDVTSYAGYSMADMMNAIDDINGRKVQDKKVNNVRPKKETQNKSQEIPIPLKKPSIIEEVKKKAQIKEERMLKEKLLKKEQEEAEKNASKVKDYLETDADYKEETGYDPTQCSLCKGTCKRGVKLSCCGVRACRACAVLDVTKTRKCWRIGCEKPVTTADIVNDHEMRQKVAKMVEDKAEGHFDKEWPKFA